MILRFSALQRAEIAEIIIWFTQIQLLDTVSVLFNEPKLLKFSGCSIERAIPKLGFSALQRAEIAEILEAQFLHLAGVGFSALQRAEIAEIFRCGARQTLATGFQCSSTSRNC